MQTLQETLQPLNTPNNEDIKPVKKYDTKQYNKNFFSKNEEKIKEKVKCNICCGSYTYFNKSKHIRSKKHIEISEKINLLLQNHI